jgi:pimeloyl-ACP methyl ester carboxylesterase
LPDEEMSMELLANSLIAILDAENIAKCILVGHSMGGYVSLAFAEHFPDRLSGLSLVHSSAFEDDDEKKLARSKAINLIQHEGKEPFLKAMIPNLYADSFKMKHPGELAWHLTMAMEISSKTLENYYLAMIKRPTRTSILSNTKMPVQFVIGAEDKAVPAWSTLQQSYLPEISDVHVLEGIGHCSMIETPERLNTILNSFCKYTLNN